MEFQLFAVLQFFHRKNSLCRARYFPVAYGIYRYKAIGKGIVEDVYEVFVIYDFLKCDGVCVMCTYIQKARSRGIRVCAADAVFWDEVSVIGTDFVYYVADGIIGAAEVAIAFIALKIINQNLHAFFIRIVI